MELKIEYLSTAELIPYINNSRTHSDEQVQQVAASIKEFGFNNPILIDEHKGIIAGHGRLLAAQLLSLTSIPTITLKGLTEAQRKAYVIADNQLALNADWDTEKLKVELERLTEIDFDLDLLGFDKDFLDGLLIPEPEQGLTDEDSVPDIEDNPVTVLGDIWELGDHRLMCGDSTSIDAVDMLMDGNKADMVFTDPPYNVGYKGTMSRTSKNGKQISHITACSRHDDIHNDSKTKEDFNSFINDILSNIKLICKGSWYISFSSQTLEQLLTPLRNNDMNWKSIIIWMKNQSTISGKDYKSRYEPIVYGDFGKNFVGQKYHEEDIWEIQKTLKNDLHPTMKPINLIVKAINNSSKKENLIVDLFLGSGSTLIAAEQTNRRCYGIELEPKYCDVIIKRWQDYTGKQATLNGVTFDEMVKKSQTD